MKPVNIVVRNIPNSAPKHVAANRIRLKGHTSRKRGRGARVCPRGFRDYRGRMCYQGGEYQDLPLDKAARFSMYLAPTDYHPETPNKKLYYDYVGMTEDGTKLRVRAGDPA
jgi:hypothetical protein